MPAIQSIFAPLTHLTIQIMTKTMSTWAPTISNQMVGDETTNEVKKNGVCDQNVGGNADSSNDESEMDKKLQEELSMT